MQETYESLYPNLTPLFAREGALAVVDQLIFALEAEDLYRLTDFHWLVLYCSLDVMCDLHNDGALRADGRVGPYIIDRIDLDAIAETFFFGEDFLFGSEFRVATE